MVADLVRGQGRLRRHGRPLILRCSTAPGGAGVPGSVHSQTGSLRPMLRRRGAIRMIRCFGRIRFPFRLWG